MAFESIENAHFRAKNANRVIASAHICMIIYTEHTFILLKLDLHGWGE